MTASGRLNIVSLATSMRPTSTSVGLFKIQTGKESNLSALEKAACQWLLEENNPAYKVDEDDASIDEVSPNAGMVVEEEALRHSALVTS